MSFFEDLEIHRCLFLCRVIAQYRGLWLVAPENKLVPARGRLTETPVTGDRVVLDEGGAIAAIEPRSGTIVRRAPGEVTSGQVLAANVDLALVTEPLPDPKARRLERFAALAASGGVPSALVLTKSDLDEEGYLKAAQLARRMGVADSLAVSAVTGEGMNALRQLLPPGSDRGPARRVGHRQVDAGQRAARRGAPGDRGGARVRRARPPHHGHARAAHAARAARS